ncbi:MAG: hypothetical protein ACTSSL_11325 [Candidatus Heimdallarchaeaceae archaeon]
MKQRKIFSIIFFACLLIGLITKINLLYAGGTTDNPSIIAPYNDTIVLDGIFQEWDNSSLVEINLVPIEPHDPPIVVSAKVNFAYDNSFLYGFVYIPNLEGQVYATEIMFFGREEQGETIDAIFMNASDNRVEDHGFDSFFVEPFNDGDRGGQNNVNAFTKMTNDGSYFEFQKELQSNDINGFDFDLGYGNSIGVFIVAWIDTTAPGGPNWSIADGSTFKFIRLSLGTDNGDIIHTPEMGGKINWLLSDQVYECVYLSSVDITYDGFANEDFWDSAVSHHITIYFVDWENNYIQEDNRFDGEIRFVTDGFTLYIYFEIYDEKYDEGDANIFMFGQTADMFEVDRGVDIAVMTPEAYEDMVFDQSKGEPISDIDVGGTIDGQATFIYNQSMRQIEFSKPLRSEDINGGDFQTNLGESIYFTNLAQYQSLEGPNYFDVAYNNESMPALAIHELRILGEGEEPSGNTTDTNTDILNTFPLDYSLNYSLTAIMFLMTMVIIIRKRKK